MIDDQLLVGVVLIAVGVAVGLLAYALVLNRREAALPTPPEEGADAEIGLEPHEEPDESPGTAEAEQEDEPQAVAVDAEPDEATLDEPVTDDGGPSPEKASGPEDAAGPIEAADVTVPGERKDIAALKRDDRTGRLVLVIGGRD